MTKVQLHYKLAQPLTAEEMNAVSRAHATYGIVRIQVDPALDGLTVDYDASRLNESEVKAAIRRIGIPINAERPAADAFPNPV